MRISRIIPLIVTLTFLLQSSFAQNIITIKNSCSFEGEETNQDFYIFNASNEADQIVGKIVNAFSLSKNFIVKSADCKNALATVEGKQRYILYNTSFLEDFKKDAKTKWAAYCVMAHEIGHHLNNHDFEVTESRKRKLMELEADKFAGGVLFLLGATLDEAKAGIDILQSKGESNTHPPARARAEAIANGWKNSQEHHESISHAEPTVPPIKERKPNETEPYKRPESKPSKSTDQPYIPENTSDDVTYTEVSDQLLANAVVGFWQCAFYNDLGVYVVYSAGIYANGALQVDTYMNGVFSAQFIGTWGVENGYFFDLNSQTSIYNKYKLDVYDANTISFTFTETNGTYLIPVGTIFTYGRTY
jgi:hypothetical protein